MGERANVQSVEALRFMRLAMLKFGETCNSALGDAESDVRHTMNWLETEARTYWQGQLTKRHAMVGRCLEAVRMKRLYKDSAGRPQSAVEEEKALKVAQRMHAEAELKLKAIQRYTGMLRKEAENFRTAIQRFATIVQQDVPSAAARLDAYVIQIENYASLAMPDTESRVGSDDYQSTGGVDASQAGAMRRSADAAADKDEAAAAQKTPPAEPSDLAAQDQPSTPNQKLTPDIPTSADQPTSKAEPPSADEPTPAIPPHSQQPSADQTLPASLPEAAEEPPAKDSEPGETHGRA